IAQIFLSAPEIDMGNTQAGKPCDTADKNVCATIKNVRATSSSVVLDLIEHSWNTMAPLMQCYPKHYCGVLGIFGNPSATELTYYGLYALQHRGQESAGIVTCDGKRFHAHKGMGLVSQVFSGEVLHEMTGNMAVGHTRYSTTGSSHLRNAQPLTVDCAR